MNLVLRLMLKFSAFPDHKKPCLLKLNDAYIFQVCNLTRSTLTWFDVEHNRFTLAIPVHSHNFQRN